ncbi:MAG: RNA 2',3'-cyclic phosphodiesterase, partial [Fretibacterium sp.]|nr:RNA 2',3'-cyclic phosphodiesterase [Fretibacterium sp.]
MTEQLRTFVAVVPSEEVLDALEGYLRRLRPLARCRWVSRPQLHLTLRFLGERPPEEVEKVKAALSGVMVEPFEASLNGVGGFPNLNRPRVLWLGMRDGAEALSALASRVESALEGVGIERESRP